MKKLFVLLIIVLLMGTGFMVGCSSNQVEDTATNVTEETSTGEESKGLSGTISMAGSTSVQPLSEELAAAFMKHHPDTRLEVSGGGSGGGVRAAQEGAADFGAASREIRDDETGIDIYTIAIDGIAIIVYPDNPVADLPLEEIKKIFSGEITNWSQVGGDNADIVVVTREEGSGTRGAFEEIVLGDANMADTAIIQNSTGAIRETVSTDINAIGYVSLGGLNQTVKGVMVDGVEPTVSNIQAGSYTVARPFNYLSKAGTPLSELAQAYIDFALSAEGQQVVQDNGFVPIK